MNQTTQFLERLHEGGEHVYLWTSEGKRSTWYNARDPLPSLNGRAKNVYFGVHPCFEIPPTNSKGEPKEPDWVRSQNEYVGAVSALFSEFDGKDFEGGKPGALAHAENLEPAPSVKVDSGGGYHAYWLLAEPFYLNTEEDRDYARRMQSAWVEFTQGDEGAKDLARVLRLPGTKNHKYNPPRPVKILHCALDDTYTLPNLESYVKDILAVKEPPKPTGIPVATGRDLTPYVQKSLDAVLHEMATADPGTRDTTIFNLAQRIGDFVGAAWAHLDRATAINMAMGAAGHNSLFNEIGETAIKDKIERGIDKGALTPATEPTDNRQSTMPPREPPMDEDEPPWSAQDDIGGDIAPLSNSTQTREPENLDFLTSKGANDEGNAQCVKRLYPGHFLYCEAYGWLAHTGHNWERENAEMRLNRAIVATLKKRQHAGVDAEKEKVVKEARPTASNVRGCKYLFQSLVYASVNNLDSSPDLLNCQNGVIDLRTGKLTAHTGRRHFTYCLPVGYDPNADFAQWESTLLELVGGHQEMVRFLQMAVGYSLTGHTWEECLFYVYGPTRAGKGLFTETILTMMGRKPLATEVDFGIFTQSPDRDAQNFALAPLKPCRFISASESNRYSQLNSGKVKRITGGNDIYCAFKGKDHFSYRPQFKIWLSSNHPVNGDPDDDALWYRLRVIEFPNSYAGKEDKRLKAKMREPAALAGVLAWAVQGAAAWYAQENIGLVTPKRVQDATDEQRQQVDFVGQWLAECVEPMGDGDLANHFVANAALYYSYEEWCKANGVKKKGLRSLTRALKVKGYHAGEQRRHPHTKKNERGCFGVKLIE